MTVFATREQEGGRRHRRLASVLQDAAWGTKLPYCDDEDVRRLRQSAQTLATALEQGTPVYGVTQGFGPLVDYAGSPSSLEQGAGLISHLSSGQGAPLRPEVCRLVVWLRLHSMLQGYSAVAPEFWNLLADLWNSGFTPAIPRDGTVSASGDLQPLAHAALAFAGTGQAWVRGEAGGWSLQPADRVLAELGLQPVRWPAREALAFVNGTSVGLALTMWNHREVARLTCAAALLSGRMAQLVGANPEAYEPGVGHARGQHGQLLVSEWIRGQLGADARRDPDRPLQEPYSLRCAPQVLGAVVDDLASSEEILLREATGCTDNPVTTEGRILHGGNFHAMPVGFASDRLGLALHQVAYLVDRQLALLCSPSGSGSVPPMLTPRPGSGSGLAGVQISATSFIARIRQLVYPATLTSLPTNGGNQDHVPMALNGANAVSEALDHAWLVLGSAAVGLTQYAAIRFPTAPRRGLWRDLAEVSPPLDHDRPLGGEVRAARDLLAESGELHELYEQAW